MDSIENYPWAESLKVSEKDFKLWQSEGAENSFTFWSLQNKVVNPRHYFDWAVQHYQIPFLEGAFFEQHLMTKSKWEKIKDLSEWSEELLPVSLWEGAVFIGCVEPPSIEEKAFKFKHYFVLTNSAALKILWRFTRQLEKDVRSDARPPLKAVSELETASRQAKTGGGLSSKIKNTLQKKAITPDLPSEVEKSHLQGPIIQKPFVQAKLKENIKPSPVAVQSAELRIDTRGLKAKGSFPEEEEERLVETENNTFPGRPSREEDNNLIMGDFKSKSSKSLKSDPPTQKTATQFRPATSSIQETATQFRLATSSTQETATQFRPATSPIQETATQSRPATSSIQETATQFRPATSSTQETATQFRPVASSIQEAASQSRPAVSLKQKTATQSQKTLDSECTKTGSTTTGQSTHTGVLKTKTHHIGYDDLWKHARDFFIACMVLKVKNNQIFASFSCGRIMMEKTSETIMDLKEHSLFKVVQKGHPYHGFVVDTPANKKFFQKIGWKSYPSHVTAIPIKNEKQELKQVFVGLGTKPLLRMKIKNIEKVVSDFFQSHRQKISQAA